MKKLNLVAILAAFAVLALGCGDTPSKKVPKSTNNGANNGANNVSPLCGNGVLDPGENCDPQIVGGEGFCPDSCAAPACATVSHEGNASDCTARCIAAPVACAAGDGCCPLGCDSTTDSDCTNLCGNDIIEPPETCDGDCLDSCDDGNACTFDVGAGSVSTCSIICEHRALTACINDDGCCPSNCTNANDSDCAAPSLCGNNILDPGETCDGDCPSSCIDGDSCTLDIRGGDRTTCNVVCDYRSVTSCADNDGCCAPGCSSNNDNDCGACMPTSCIAEGVECGPIADGCGGALSCGGCAANESCDQGQCVTNTVNDGLPGSPCIADADCLMSSLLPPTCLQPPAYPGGYCVDSTIPGLAPCPNGSACVNHVRADTGAEIIACAKSCQSPNDCRPGYFCAPQPNCTNDGTMLSVCVPVVAP